MNWLSSTIYARNDFQYRNRRFSSHPKKQENPLEEYILSGKPEGICIQNKIMPKASRTDCSGGFRGIINKMKRRKGYFCIRIPVCCFGIIVFRVCIIVHCCGIRNRQSLRLHAQNHSFRTEAANAYFNSFKQSAGLSLSGISGKITVNRSCQTKATGHR